MSHIANCQQCGRLEYLSRDPNHELLCADCIDDNYDDGVYTNTKTDITVR